MQAHTFVIIVFSTWFCIHNAAAEYSDSINLKHQLSGFVCENSHGVKWNRSFENPMSLSSRIYKTHVEYLIRKVTESNRIEPQNVIIIFSNWTNYLWVDYSYDFYTSCWIYTDFSDGRLVNSLRKHGYPYIDVQFRITYPISSSSVREPMYFEGDEDTPYKTSTQITLVFVDVGYNWSSGLMNPKSQLFTSQCGRLNKYINMVSAEMRWFGTKIFECSFWSLDGKVHVAASTLIPFNEDGAINNVESYIRFKRAFIEHYVKLKTIFYWRQNVKQLMLAYTTPIQYAGPPKRPMKNQEHQQLQQDQQNQATNPTRPVTEDTTSLANRALFSSGKTVLLNLVCYFLCSLSIRLF